MADAMPTAGAGEQEALTARMVNEYVYCPRLFYYEFVDGVFMASADTLRGSAEHRRVDKGSRGTGEGGGERKGKKAGHNGEEGGSAVINQAEDQVLFVELGQTATRGQRVIESLGVPYKMDAACYVI